MERGVSPKLQSAAALTDGADRSRMEEREKSLPRHRHRGNHVGQHAVGVEAFQFGLGLEHHAMAQHRLHGALDVVGNQVVAAIESSRAWATRIRLRAARGLAPSSSVGHSRVRRASDRM